ncbi:MAG: hypothetical protein AAF560_12235 [Acidobacteriota bacterium]
MRGVRKPWPPQKIDRDGNDPRRLVDAEKEYLVALSNKEAHKRSAFARGQFDDLRKRELREVLYREQGALCVYCERDLVERHPEPRIDHWRPLSLNPELALHWENLYLACPADDTCDGRKGNRPLKWDKGDPDLPWPTELAYEDIVGFTSLGEIFVRADAVIDDATRKALQLAIEDQLDGGRVRKAILDLNHPAIVAARAAALDSERKRLEKDYENETASGPDREKRADALLERSRRPAFVSIRAAWLRKALGKGRE